MVYAFQSGVTYNDDRSPEMYMICTNAIQWLDYWQVWGVWYHKETNERVIEHKRWFVDKKLMRHWHYGKFGPN